MVISVIIVSYNTKDLTLKCIDSVFSSQGSLDLEVIVVDNGSSDGSLEELRDLLKSKSGKLKLIENGQNLGFSKANNQGIKEARGKYILLLNSDTIVKDDSLNKLVGFAEKTPDAGVIGPRLLNSDGSVQPSCFYLPTIGKAVKEFWFGQKGIFEKYSPKGDSPQEVEAVVGAAFLITPKAKEKVGALNEKYFFYFEDLDYCRKVRSIGLKVYYFPGAEVVHYHGISGKNEGSKKQKDRLVESSKIYHGIIGYYILTGIIWGAQKWRKYLKK